ncbi:cation diffusion facilitator family transporter [Lancefieldella parvula]|uniref:cation diffusion facilitator family transporter n=1 Tax=Lancefieldella parvula TaxID=1382 RepID=UPI0028804D3B|nr:cation diffusion facilitator family transporter [Lancefieldella parvula]
MTQSQVTITSSEREAAIVRTSAIGIAANVVLAAFKAAVGILSNSIAVTLDAVNNLSDAISSIITIVGTKLSNKKADREHPFGHGRIEYITTTVIAAIIMYAGISSLIKSIQDIMNPATPDYSPLSLVIIAVAVLVKIVLGHYVRTIGNRVNSDTLVASGSDALFDAMLSTSVLAAALIFIFTGISLEAYVGVVISAFIIKASIELLHDSIKEIIGMRPDAALSTLIYDIVKEDPDAEGVYDLIIHNYGPDRFVGSFHTEVLDTTSAIEIDTMTRRLSTEIYKQTSGKIIIAAIGIYARNTTDNRIVKMRTEVTEMALAHEGVLQVHGFIADIENQFMAFDTVIEFGYDGKQIVHDIIHEVEAAYPDMNVSVLLDRDTSDLSEHEEDRDLH